MLPIKGMPGSFTGVEEQHFQLLLVFFYAGFVLCIELMSSYDIGFSANGIALQEQTGV